MYKEEIPVIILSAGIGNVIEQFLKQNECYFENIFIISNFIEFNENGDMKRYERDIIHTLNKTMQGHLSKKLEAKLSKRPYRLLLGDTIEDKKMIDQKEWDDTITVGFLNEKIKENLEVYKNNFDIVLTKEDATFEVVEKIALN
jgi:5'-nucleotidase